MARPKPWRRETAGVYRSADDRFVVESDGSGRWYVRDEDVRDELGLARTTGPFANLAEAKSATEGLRARGPEPSPLATRIREVAEGSQKQRAKGQSIRRRRPATGSDGRADQAEGQAISTPPPPARSQAARRTWLDELRERDPDLAASARAMIAGLERVGLDDADGIVRRDVLGDQPAVSERLLIEALRRAVAAELSPEALAAEAHRRHIDPERPDALSRLAVERTLDVTLGILADDERLEGQPSRLPGWQLVERGGKARRVRVSRDDLE
jgi:hypothetical protein